jgi:LmbE family N-acetylglucosaminyl deacetylase
MAVLDPQLDHARLHLALVRGRVAETHGRGQRRFSPDEERAAPVTNRCILLGAMLLSTAVFAGEAIDAQPPAPLWLGRVHALIISPHPDDATLAAGGLIQRVIHEGGTVRVIEMTGGDAFPKSLKALSPRVRPTALSYRWYGSLREREAIRAMRQLGVPRSQLRFLGFPDEGLCVLASVDRAAPTTFESPYTKRESPPNSEQIVPGTVYRGDDVIRELTQLIEEFRPTLVVLPHPGDLHPDHCATHLLARQALADAVNAGLRPPRVLHYILHYPEWPSGEKVDAPLEPPLRVRPDEWSWKTLTLTSAERAAKGRALNAYRSQMLIMADFLRSFERPNELFIEGEPPRPTACWCGGANIVTPASGAQ